MRNFFILFINTCTFSKEKKKNQDLSESFIMLPWLQNKEFEQTF